MDSGASARRGEPETTERSPQMIVVVGRVVTDAARREDLKRIGQAVARASRAEEGCLSYRVYEDTELDNEFVFVEEWESQQALERHFGTPHIAEFMGAIRATVAAPPDVRFHTIESSVDLADLNTRA
jgi:quinol monooxygenase YgiN